jgi:hypothetical protein
VSPTGEVEGEIVSPDGDSLAGVELELLGPDGVVAARAMSEYDGFFLFERVAYGSYSIRVSKDSAAAAKIAAELGLHVTVSPDKSVVRLGTVRPLAEPHLAQAAAALPDSALH